MRGLIFLLLLISLNSYGQVKPGFNTVEARDLIALCNSYTYLELYGNDQEIIPEGYLKTYTSPDYGMDNKFQVYVHNKVGIINFRGSTAERISWLENMYAAMIPVEDTIKVNGDLFHYKVGSDTSGAVHAGYVLGLYFLKDDILDQLRNLQKKGISDVIITGHSQGGAIALMTQAFLYNLPKEEGFNNLSIKCYAFANPMIGNHAYSNEFSSTFCAPGLSFTIHNPEDAVPKMPMTYNDSNFMKSQVRTILFDSESFSLKQSFSEGMKVLFDNKLQGLSHRLGRSLNKQIGKELGNIVMPEFKDDINYAHLSNQILISPTEYPLELKDSSILSNDSLMAIYKRDENGIFEEKGLYKKDKWTLQHKPYNYYTAILKDYFNNQYQALEQKYFIRED